MKYSAEALSKAGDKYLGRSYQEMDCQAFVERCMADVGYKRNLPGSNAWFRAMDWTGSPEECVRIFGCVPDGACLFILSQNGKEPAKYKGDGIGNASHIGLVTHRNDGAIHSSSSRGCVATSKFKDKSINGGWNRVGLLKVFDYGKAVNWMLEHPGADSGQADQGAAPASPGGKEDMPMQGTVTAMNGKTVNLRTKPSISAPLVDRVPIGADVDVIEYGESWCKVQADGKTGWMMTEFIQLDGEIVPGCDDPVTPDPDPDPDTWMQLKVRYDELAAAYPFLQSICDQIVDMIGRG